MKNKNKIITLGFILLTLSTIGCTKIQPSPATTIAPNITEQTQAEVNLIPAQLNETQNIFIVVIDGIRYSEAFGDAYPYYEYQRHEKCEYIPHLCFDLKPVGTFFPNVWIEAYGEAFKGVEMTPMLIMKFMSSKIYLNETFTLTVPGHLAMLTGAWQAVSNDGLQKTSDPTIFEYCRKQKNIDSNKTWVVAGKARLFQINYSTNNDYGAEYGAEMDYPSNVISNGSSKYPNGTVDFEKSYRDDNATYKRLLEIIDTYHPSLVVLNLGEVDHIGHQGDWDRYVDSIKNADRIVYDLWTEIQEDPYYSGKTTLFVTTDHGRHDDPEMGNISFSEHNDRMINMSACNGTRHIFLLALGPNIKKGYVVDRYYRQIDIGPSAAYLLGINMSFSYGKPMREMIIEPDS